MVSFPDARPTGALLRLDSRERDDDDRHSRPQDRDHQSDRAGPPVQTIEYLQHDRRRTEHQSVVGRRAGSRRADDLRVPVRRSQRSSGAIWAECSTSTSTRARRVDAASRRPAITAVHTGEHAIRQGGHSQTGHRRRSWSRRLLTIPASAAISSVTRRDASLPREKRRRSLLTRSRSARSTTDGWYIDLERRLSCEASWRSGHFYAYWISVGPGHSHRRAGQTSGPYIQRCRRTRSAASRCGFARPLVRRRRCRTEHGGRSPTRGR